VRIPYERLRGLFSGWDAVEIQHYDGPGVTQVRLVVTDQNLHGNMMRNLRAVPVSSRTAEKLLEHRPGQMRFYGRKGDRRFR
jgi:hypothetical protein